MTDDNSGTENKVIFLGEAGVGKTSLIKVGIGEKFESSYNSSISLSFLSLLLFLLFVFSFFCIHSIHN